MSARLSDGVASFAELLRREHGFSLGPEQTGDALRALETVGVGNRERARAALRCVFCSKCEETAIFDRAFEEFFSGAASGVAQRRRRDAGDGPVSRVPAHAGSAATAWEALRARYSPAPGLPRAPVLPRDGYARAFADARRLIARLRRGVSRRWRPQRNGRRLDVRRTLRACLRTAGEPIELRTLGHPRRDPRFVVLIDGSRSMTDDAGSAMQFALALCRQTRRARVFAFSTQLEEMTRALREARPGSIEFAPIGEAWGGGTRIGANLREFVRRHGSLLDERSYVMIFSDGLDTGDVPLLRRAVRDVARRSGDVVWINPHAGTPGFAPQAAGMRAALPYLSALVGPAELRDLA